ncbi:MAG TPA: hypothetical protein VF587_19725 [Solirubrobacteraceae bacterium]
MTWDDVVAVLREWEGRDVVIVPILDPGISLTPFSGPLAVDEPKGGVIRIRTDPHYEPYISLFRATFISSDWVAGREERGLSVVQGGTRVDVHLDGTEPT